MPYLTAAEPWEIVLVWWPSVVSISRCRPRAASIERMVEMCLVYFCIGLILGGTLGAVAIALMVASRDEDSQ
jgi:hypothetical protein